MGCNSNRSYHKSEDDETVAPHKRDASRRHLAENLGLVDYHAPSANVAQGIIGAVGNAVEKPVKAEVLIVQHYAKGLMLSAAVARLFVERS